MIVHVNPWPSRNLPKPAPSKSRGKVVLRDKTSKAVKAVWENGKRIS